MIKESCLKGILAWEPGTVMSKWLRSSTIEKVCKGVDEASEVKRTKEVGEGYVRKPQQHLQRQNSIK